jgi:hypothetical protein
MQNAPRAANSINLESVSRSADSRTWKLRHGRVCESGSSSYQTRTEAATDSSPDPR